MKIFLALAFYNTCKHRSVCFVKIKVVKFALDLGVMKTKIKNQGLGLRFSCNDLTLG